MALELPEPTMGEAEAAEFKQLKQGNNKHLQFDVLFKMNHHKHQVNKKSFVMICPGEKRQIFIKHINGTIIFSR